MRIKILLLNLILLCIFSQSFAHALWIETSPTGKQGQAQEVKIFFGEYAADERDSTAKWFSNLKDAKLWITLPNGEKQQLTCNATALYFSAYFTPAQSGVYTLSITHEVKDLHATSKIEYYCGASVQVGALSDGNSNIVDGTNLAIQAQASATLKSKEVINVAVFFKKVLLPMAKVTIASPDGWVKNIETNASGIIQFKPIEKGRYMVEALYTDKTPGTHYGKDYKAVWHCITYCIEVK